MSNSTTTGSSSASSVSPPPSSSQSPPSSIISSPPPPPKQSPPPPPPSVPSPSPPPTPSSSSESNNSQSSNPPPPATSSSPPPPPPLSTSSSHPPPPLRSGTQNAPLTPSNSVKTPHDIELSPPTTASARPLISVGNTSPATYSNRTPLSGTPSGHSDTEEVSSDPEGGSDSGVIVGLALTGIVVLVAFVFLISRRKKRSSNELENRYVLPNASVRSEGHYHRQPEGSFAGSNPSGSYRAPVSSVHHSGGCGGQSGESFRGQRNNSGQFDPKGSKSCFSYEELADATHGFSRETLLGEGGFGCVYKGWLQDGKCVAVKQLKAGSGQGEREFRAEVDIISRVHHRHLVTLVGYCIVEHHRLLAYEFVPNGTLEHHLHDKGVPIMDWSKRMRIASGSARGLAYLHEDCQPRIIHRDIKSANILLDSAFEAQVADFGLAKLSNDTNTHVSTRIMGTFGYLAPEYAASGKLTDRSDVFSFGVVLLEIITGRKPVDPSRPLGDESLVEWARPLMIHTIETGEFGELVDPRLEGNFARNEMFRMIEVAATCTRHSAPKRPRMVQVVRALEINEGDNMDLSNGVKVGQSTVYDSGQYNADIQRFRKMAFGSGEFNSEYSNSGNHEHRSSANTGEMYSRSGPNVRPPQYHPSQSGFHSNSSDHDNSSEHESHPMTYRAGDRDGDHRYGGRGYS